VLEVLTEIDELVDDVLILLEVEDVDILILDEVDEVEILIDVL
jgi:hypothetical protein